MTTSRLASEIARKKERDTDRKAVALELATDKAAKLKFKDRGTSGDKELKKIENASYKKKTKSHLVSYRKRKEDEANVNLYGKDAMKGKGFATTGRPKSINAGASRPATQSGTPKGK
jgi:hypothetical protein